MSQSEWKPPIELNGIETDKLDRESLIFIHYVLAGKPQSVSDICKKLKLKHQTVCYHTQQLHDKGLIYCVEQQGRTIKYSPQDYFKDNRRMLRLWDRFAQFAELLFNEMEIGCLIEHSEEEEQDLEDAVLHNMTAFISLFLSHGAIHLDPDKLREKTRQ